MKTVIVNGEERRLDASSLAGLLAELDYAGDWLATAVNGEVVHRDERAARAIARGDRVEILSPMEGG